MQTLALVGPQVDHTRWTEHKGNVYVESWSKECILLWIVPSRVKPRVPNLWDRFASEEILPTCIYFSSQVYVYGYVTNYSSGVHRIQEIDKEATSFSIDGVNPSWKNWEQGIKARMAKRPYRV